MANQRDELQGWQQCYYDAVGDLDERNQALVDPLTGIPNRLAYNGTNLPAGVITVRHCR